MLCIIVIDNSNIFIEGRKLSAARKGIPAKAGGDPATDPSWRIHFATLLDELANGIEVFRAILVGSKPPPSDSVWNSAARHGFAVTTHYRDGYTGGEKAIDTELVAQATELVCDAGKEGVLIIASGDRDFIPLVNLAHRRGWTVEMAAFQSAFQANGEMATQVDMVRPLDAIFNRISDYAYEWPAPDDAV